MKVVNPIKENVKKKVGIGIAHWNTVSFALKETDPTVPWATQLFFIFALQSL